MIHVYLTFPQGKKKKNLETQDERKKKKACVRERKHWRESDVHDPGVSYISREKTKNQTQIFRTSERKREPVCTRENKGATHMIYVYRVAKTHRMPYVAGHFSQKSH